MYRHRRVMRVMDEAAGVVRDLFVRFARIPTICRRNGDGGSTSWERLRAPAASPISSPA